MADNKEEKASFVEVIGAIAGMVASVVNPIIKDIPTPQEPPAIETPAEPSNQDFEDLIDKVADIADVISDANKKKDDDDQTAEDIDAMNAMIDRTPTNDIDRDNNPDGKSDDVKNENESGDDKHSAEEIYIDRDNQNDDENNIENSIYYHRDDNKDDDKDIDDIELDNEGENKYTEGNGTGAEWTAEGTARINGYVDAYYKAEQIKSESEKDAETSEGSGSLENLSYQSEQSGNHSDGREMDDVTRQQIEDKEREVEEFLARQEEKAAEREAELDAENREKVDEDGDRIDEFGNKIDENGNRIDEDGDRIDEFGNKIDENGNRID